MYIPPTYITSYEDETYDILAFNLKGHGYSPGEIEMFLHEVAYCEHEMEQQWNITETYLRQVPHPDGGSTHMWTGRGPGATPVTRLDFDTGWNLWCYHHPTKQATIGIPGSTLKDGEALILARLKELETDIDPRVSVEFRSPSQSYLYMCKPCGADFKARQEAARRSLLAATGLT